MSEASPVLNIFNEEKSECTINGKAETEKWKFISLYLLYTWSSFHVRFHVFEKHGTSKWKLINCSKRKFIFRPVYRWPRCFACAPIIQGTSIKYIWRQIVLLAADNCRMNNIACSKTEICCNFKFIGCTRPFKLRGQRNIDCFIFRWYQHWFGNCIRFTARRWIASVEQK